MIATYHEPVNREQHREVALELVQVDMRRHVRQVEDHKDEDDEAARDGGRAAGDERAHHRRLDLLSEGHLVARHGREEQHGLDVVDAAAVHVDRCPKREDEIDGLAPQLVGLRTRHRDGQRRGGGVRGDGHHRRRPQIPEVGADIA